MPLAYVQISPDFTPGVGARGLLGVPKGRDSVATVTPQETSATAICRAEGSSIQVSGTKMRGDRRFAFSNSVFSGTESQITSRPVILLNKRMIGV